MKTVFSWIVTMALCFSHGAFGEHQDGVLPDHVSAIPRLSQSVEIPLRHLTDTAMSTLEEGATFGACSEEIPAAARLVQNLVFYRQSSESDYVKGRASIVWDSNAGLRAYFKDLESRSTTFKQERQRFIQRVRQYDAEHPIAHLVGNRPHVDEEASIDAYAKALEITNGNVLRAVTLIAGVAHDDLSSDVDLYPSSQVFARSSLRIEGRPIEVPKSVLDDYKKASQECLERYRGRENFNDCAGAGSAFNYHVNFGFFLGCELAKHGFGNARIGKFLADTAAKRLDDPFVYGYLRECKVERRRLTSRYCVDLPRDIPQALGYLYKRTTLYNWVQGSPAAIRLLRKGYNQPFLNELDPQTWGKPPEGMKASDFQDAVALLNYRLMHLYYGAAQARAGAEAGAKLCREYVTKVMPRDLSPEERELYLGGNFDSRLEVEDLFLPTCHPASPISERQSAWNRLRKKLRGFPESYDYTSMNHVLLGHGHNRH